MISKTQKKKLYQYLKGAWIDDVLQDLADRNITNKFKQPYSKAMIRHVMSGRNENLEIETSILSVYAVKKSESKTLEKQKKQIIAA